MDYKMKRAASAKVGKKFAAALSAAVLVAPSVAQAVQPMVALADEATKKSASVKTYVEGITEGKAYAAKFDPAQEFTYKAVNSTTGEEATSATTAPKWYIESYVAPDRDGYIFAGWKVRTTTTGGTGTDVFDFTQDKKTGYYIDRTGTFDAALASAPDEGGIIELVAQWVESVDITYDMNGGTSKVDSEEVKLDSTNPADLNLKAVPEKTGYTLYGWTVDGVDKDGGVLSEELDDVLGNKTSVVDLVNFLSDNEYDASKGIKMTAIWARNEYTIEYGLNGGKDSDTQVKQQVIKYVDASKAYKTTKAVTRDDKDVPAADLRNIFDTGIGYEKITNWVCPKTSDVVALGGKFVAPEDLEDMSTDGTIKLVAMYGEDDTATLTFKADTDGVNVADPVSIEDVDLLNTNNDALDKLVEIYTKVPENLDTFRIDSKSEGKTNKKFVGWKNGETVYKYDEDATVANKRTALLGLLNAMQREDQGVTLEAVWEDTYLVEILPGKDTLNDTNALNYYLDTLGTLTQDTDKADAEYYFGLNFRIAPSDKVSLPKNVKNGAGDQTTTGYNPAIANSTFAGWTSADGKKVFDAGSKVTADVLALANKDGLVQLYASWNPKGAKFIVNYDQNTGKGTTMAASTFHVGDGLKLSKNTYVKDNHEFLGWTILKQGTGTVFSDEASHEGVIETTALRNGKQAVTLYAKWGKQYTIKFDAGDTKDTVKATGTTADQAAVETKTADLNACGFVKDGYTFAGWEYDGKAVSSTADLDSYATAGGSLTVTATWVHTSSPEVEVTKEALKKSVEAAKAVKPEDYTEETAKAFADALKAAEDVLADEKATQAQVDDANLNLKLAQAALKEKPAPAPAPADGWHQLGNDTWEYVKDGEAVKGAWVNDGGNWFYMNSNGIMHDGWLKDGDNWYFLSQDHDGSFGAMKTGWVMSDGKWYYMNPSVGGPKGAMMTGWQQVNGKWYYLYEQAGAPKGSCAVSTTTPDGYRVDASGAWIQ